MFPITEKKIISEILKHEGCADFITDLFHVNLLNNSVKPFTNFNSQLKSFTGISGKSPTEKVSIIDKGLLRKTIVKALKKRAFDSNLPYLHLAYYPKGYHTIVTFRVDCDVSDKESFFHLLKISEKYSFPLTWFLHLAFQESYIHEIDDIRKNGHEVQLHCYDHETYPSYIENKRNILKGKNIMEKEGFKVSGFVSPFGKWNHSLNRVLEEIKVNYSSEFAIGYDDFPFYPLYKNRRSKILQLPIHPICIGSLRKSGFTNHEMMNYFEKIITSKYERQEPIMLYGHPKNEIDNYPDVINFIFTTLKGLPDVWIATYTEYAKWWKKRLSAKYSVSIKGDFLTIKTDNTNPDLQLHIEKQDSLETYVPLLTAKLSMAHLKWTYRKEFTELSIDGIGSMLSDE